MDFFEAQERARQRTNRLVVLFAFAVFGTILTGYVAAIFLLGQVGSSSHHGRYAQFYADEIAPTSWWNPTVFAGVALGTLAVVGLASLFKWTQMRDGGSAVAEAVGGRRLDPHTTDLRERRLLNVVEEMAIASGVPVPAVYVMDEEVAINAFAAGLTTSDAVVAVTRGTLDRLNRDELQGVIAHEFSHILNGDMRLNLKLTAIVFGILVLGLAGRGILWGMTRGRIRGGKNQGGVIVAIIAAGVALLIVGYIGYFFGRLIQAAVSRQREFLADASAVQFTRNPLGIGNALKKIGGLAIQGELINHEAAQFGHFFFAQGFRSNFGGLWATHPPLAERLRAIDQRFDGKFIDAPEVVDVAHESFADAGLGPKTPKPPAPPPLQPLSPVAAVALIGSLTPDQVSTAQELLARVPPRLRDAARQPGEAAALLYALLLDVDPVSREKQFALIGAQGGADALRATRELAGQLASAPADTRLPLVNLSLPALRNLPDAALEKFSQTADALILADGEVSVFEFMVQKALIRHVVVARQPQAHDSPAIFSFHAVAAEIGLVLSMLASASANAATGQAAAFAAGAEQLPLVAAELRFTPGDTPDFTQLAAALDKLATASGPIKQRMLLAAAHVVSNDGVIQPTEAELLRAVADTLGCPMPPLQSAA